MALCMVVIDQGDLVVLVVFEEQRMREILLQSSAIRLHEHVGSYRALYEVGHALCQVKKLASVRSAAYCDNRCAQTRQ